MSFVRTDCLEGALTPGSLALESDRSLGIYVLTRSEACPLTCGRNLRDCESTIQTFLIFSPPPQLPVEQFPPPTNQTTSIICSQPPF